MISVYDQIPTTITERILYSQNQFPFFILDIERSFFFFEEFLFTKLLPLEILHEFSAIQKLFFDYYLYHFTIG